MRSRQYLYLLATALVFVCFYSVLHIEGHTLRIPSNDAKPEPPPNNANNKNNDNADVYANANSNSNGGSNSNSNSNSPQTSSPDPIAAPKGAHPMWRLITTAEQEFEKVKARQSKTLAEAVAEYRRRYGMAPPPHFDKWFAFAQENGVVLVDEFDTIMEQLRPFWGLSPSTIRARAKEALGYGNSLLGVAIRNGKVTLLEGGGDWQREATEGMLSAFVEHLPNLDLAFNLHDEPRVVVPHEDMARLLVKARETTASAQSNADQKLLKNGFTKKPTGLNDGTRFDETALTRFNVFAHQATWTHSRMSCPPDSPARGLDETQLTDDVSKYGISQLGFVYNTTALSDVCLTPSLRDTFGFFERPNAYSLVQDLFPVFSQSKVSSYNDLLYPSPWYWYQKVAYDETKDMPWAEKKDQLYWRGSTTGGFSRDGGWRRQHRQRFVTKINAADRAMILVNKASSDEVDAVPDFRVKEVARSDYKDLMNVYFSHVGQCDDGDCEAQKQFFTIQSHADQQDAWQYKYLVDLDGNAFSGRFYAFLQSRSLVYKQAVFREWHYEWLRAWVHYIPLSLRGDDWLEAVRFFGDGALGKKEAERLALQQREWANRAVRNVDLEAWFFRLLLEYGRVVDDDREKIGYL